MKPAFITFTGLDRFADLGRVKALDDRYPIEWGILLSPTRQGTDVRYPDLPYVFELVSQPVRTAIHLCGGYGRMVIENVPLPQSVDDLLRRTGRIQVNEPRGRNASLAVRNYMTRVNPFAHVILQCGEFPTTDNGVHWLHDLSAGHGSVPVEWPAPRVPGAFVGFAGGIGPKTIGRTMTALESFPPTPYWIDMESGVRSGNHLDLNHVEAVCRAVYGD